MKKVFLLMAIAATVSFVSCSSDDDSSGSNCNTCGSIKTCDNGDSTYSITVEGETTTLKEADLNGLGFDNYVKLLCLTGSLGV